MASNNDYCCVPQCNSLAKKDTERKLTFHRFSEANARQVYIENEMGKFNHVERSNFKPSQKLPVSTVGFRKPKPHLIELIDIKGEIEVHAQAKMKILKNVILK
ncbi:unnamed protein product [Callosobruchus maculatus]|uniref:THAP-type domain-containing protein n=1 Tax=Callosobruchus maculatus TaxID=64391 RepID=A0A653DHE6_CALMS|nr:unnamed protein product [Callosobruchus maculatus]